jgi:hypothetical protein
LKAAFKGVNINKINIVNEDFANKEEDSEDFEPLIYDIEEIDYKLTDLDEHSYGEKELMMRSMKSSIIHNPKDFPLINPSGKINDSVLNHSIAYQGLESGYEYG